MSSSHDCHGHVDPSVLVLQKDHRSSSILENEPLTDIKCVEHAIQFNTWTYFILVICLCHLLIILIQLTVVASSIVFGLFLNKQYNCIFIKLNKDSIVVVL